MREKNFTAGFSRGYRQLTIENESAARQDLMRALGVNQRASFAAYRRGSIEPKVSQAAAVEAVFSKYGITEVWGK